MVDTIQGRRPFPHCYCVKWGTKFDCGDWVLCCGVWVQEEHQGRLILQSLHASLAPVTVCTTQTQYYLVMSYPWLNALGQGNL